MSSLFPPPDVKVLGVGELTRRIKQLLEEGVGTVWVEGEVSNLARPNSGHLYLTLKDEDAPLRTVIYRGVALRMRFDLQDGMRVVVRGRLTVYTPRGEYQLQAEEVLPKGIGPLELAFRQLKEKLSAKGYFDPSRRKPPPRIPRRIALVTSPTGSAVRDMLETLGRRWPSAEVWVCAVRVQGDGAAEEVAAALAWLNQLGAADGPAPVDVILLGRGGGSLEDLWTFNEERVADAIFASRIPIVTGVGHEDDLTIADLVADLRALTPTDAATKVVPERAKVLEWLAELEGRLRGFLKRNLETARARLDDLAQRRCFRQPLERLRETERRLDEWADRLERAARAHLENARSRLEGAAAQLESLSPLNVLARGYSLTQNETDGALIREPLQVRPGDQIATRLLAGRIISRVEALELFPLTPEPTDERNNERRPVV
jgi:exodeoxyribonuclease VII large subunit